MSLKFAANLSLLFTEVPFLERFAKATAYGFTAVEFHFPYDHDVNEIKSQLDSHGLQLVLFNLHPGDVDNNEWGTLSNPDKRGYFRWSLSTALDVANELRCSQINVMFGNKLPKVEPEIQMQCALDNLAWAAKEAHENGVTLLIESLNPYDFPRVFLQSPSEAINVVQSINHPNVRLLYDIYHAQMTEGNLINSIKEFYPLINHIQIADVPGRHEPGTGEIDFLSIFNTLRITDYQGFIGLEYRPASDTNASLEWLINFQSG